MDSPAAATFLDSAWSMIEDFIKSENGKRFMKLVCADLKWRLHMFVFMTFSQVPSLMAAKDMDETLSILSKEAEVKQKIYIQQPDLSISIWLSIQLNWGQFFTKIQNSDYKASALEATADYLVMAYDFVINPPKDSMMSKVTTSSKSFESNISHQAPVLINGLLVSQRLPTIDMKNPVDSLTKV